MDKQVGRAWQAVVEAIAELDPKNRAEAVAGIIASAAGLPEFVRNLELDEAADAEADAEWTEHADADNEPCVRCGSFDSCGCYGTFPGYEG